MASGKKGKKTKGKTLALTDFLQETPGTVPSVPIRKSALNWADEVEDSFDGGYDRNRENVVLPTAPKASRDYEDLSEKVPKDPPYVAYLSNLPYDVEEDEIASLFRNMKIEEMRIPRGDGSKLKGYGYVFFEDRDSLINALGIPDTTLKNRRIRIEVAGSGADGQDKRGGRMGRMDMGRGGMDRGERSDVSSGDWRSGPRVESSRDGGGGGGGGGFRDRDGDRREGGGFSRDRGEDDKPGAWRDSERPRDFSRGNDRYEPPRGGSDRFERRDGPRGGGANFDRDEMRRGGFDRDEMRRGGDRDEIRRGGDRDEIRRGGDRDEMRRGGDRGGFDRDEMRRGGDRDGDRRTGFGRRRDDEDDRNGGFRRGGDDRDQERTSNEPRQRPKLQLAPRTKPIEAPVVPPVEPAPAAEERVAPVPAASIFGAAKPVNTAQREREIEERLAKEQQEKASTRTVEEPRGGSRRDGDSDSRRPIERSGKTGAPSRGREPQSTDSPSHDRPSSQSRRYEEEKKSAPPPRREERREKEMPKLKEAEVPNFAANNKFAFLQEDDNSD